MLKERDLKLNSNGHDHDHGCGCGHKHDHNTLGGTCSCGMENQSSEENCCCGSEHDSHSKEASHEEDSGGDDSEEDHIGKKKHSKNSASGCGHDHSHHKEHKNEHEEHKNEHDDECVEAHKHNENQEGKCCDSFNHKECECEEEHHHNHGESCGCGGHNDSHESNKNKISTVELVIEGLHCAGCANKIEKKVNTLQEVSKAVLNFATSTLSVEVNKEKKDDVIKRIEKIVVETEPGTRVINKNQEKYKSKEYTLQGLNCAGCAAKIERKVKEIIGVKEVTLNFATSGLSIEVDHKAIVDVTQKITKIVVDLEPHVKVIEKLDDKDVSTTEEITETNNHKKKLFKLGTGAVLFGLALPFQEQSWGILLFVASYLVIGNEILMKSFKNIKKGEVFDENFLMTLATVAAFSVKAYPEAVMVMFLYEIGEYFQGRAVESSRKSIANLMDIRPEYANKKIGNDIRKVSPDEVSIGDLILVKPGEKVPLDGVIVEGSSSVDTRALTGESVPQDVEAGDEITSGFININGLLTIKVTKAFKDSAVSKILNLVQNASAKKAKSEKRITKFARYYTPTVVIIAVLLAIFPPLFIAGQTYSEWIYRAATFLVVSCPCALVISVPMTYFAGLGASSKQGVLVKGGNYLEALSKASILVFDKTGTLTEGKFKVSEIKSKNGLSGEEILKYTAHVESFSTHPIAVSIVEQYGKEINKSIIKNYIETRGKGVEAVVDGLKVSSGNIKFMRENNIEVEDVKSAGTIVYTAINGKYVGHIVIKDQVKKDAPEAMKGFKTLGVKNVVMLTGDRRLTAESAAKELGITNYHYELLPNDKVDKVEELLNKKNDKESLVFVGDGINDAPVLARADVGVAMGGVGSDAAIEAADVVIMNDEPSKLINAIKTARKTKKIVDQNIAFSLGVKIIILFLALVGIAPMWLAVFGDVGVTLLAVLNAMRVLNVK